MAVVKNLLVRAGADFSELKTEMRKANTSMKIFQSGMSSSLKKIAGIFAGAFAVKKMIDFGKASYEASNQMAVAEAKLATIMKQRMHATDGTISSVKDLISAQESIGVVDVTAQTAAAQELATYLSSAKSLKTLVPTLNDLVAQQYGLSASAEQATGMATMLGKVMDGQVGALSRYGFTFDKSQEKILKYGTEAQKTALLVDIVRDSIGNMNVELGKTPQGQLKQIGYTFDSIKMEIGRGLVPVLQALLPYIRAIANAFLMAAQYASAFVSALFGKSNSKVVVSQADAVDDLGDAYTSAGEAAKKAAGSVAGFDEVNNLADNSSSGLSGASSAGKITTPLFDAGAMDGLTEVGAKTEEIYAKAREAAEKLTNTYNEIKKAVNDLWDAMKPFATWLGGEYKRNWGILGDTIEWVWKNITIPMANAELWFWNEVLKPFGKWIDGYFVGVWSGLGKAMKAVWDNVLVPIGNAFKWLWNDVLTPFGKWLGDKFVIAWNAVKDAANAVWKNVLVPFGEYIGKLWNDTMKAFGTWLKDVFAAAWDAVKIAANGLWKNVLVPFGTFISKIWTDVLKPFTAWLSDKFTIVWNTIGDAASGLGTILSDLVSYIAGAFTIDWEKAWNGISKFFGTIFEGVKNVFKGVINFIIDNLNYLIRKMNKISVDIPDWLGGGTFGINISEIPRLAKGGITDGPMLAMVGDNPGGREVVSPLDDLVGIVQTAVSSAMQAMGGSNQSQPQINLQIDGVTFARLMNAYSAKEGARIGGAMIRTT
ncbi:MAG: hypothetical protein P0Y55_12045 [Candidatus Cohnella colombiensis]|uniref:Phage tail tape measure protein n=1 Tax=Candidatus Cohnella colombiensis TaxID=3121368 RepID=A0AA95J9H6_9BACL|nr:MAG: hypothetical protein P0Y55_12045 [Cohnella sp.]